VPHAAWIIAWLNTQPRLSTKAKEVVASQNASLPAMERGPAAQPRAVVTKSLAAAAPAEKPLAGVEYLLKMVKSSRPRHAGWYGARDIVEFRSNGGGQVMDRFTTEQLWALRWLVKRTEYGVILSAKGNEIIATTWPVDPFGEQSSATTARIKAAGSPVTSASETQPITAAAAGTAIGVAPRPMSTFPESVQHRHGGS
jgi:zona occludens toxin